LTNTKLTKVPSNLSGWPLELVTLRLNPDHHGDFKRWSDALAALPLIADPTIDIGDTISITGATDETQLNACLRVLHPWRKGPFRIANTLIDTEWRSDFKWRRLAGAIEPLTDHRVLDIGCGNGYFGWRMLACGAREVIGIDPTILFCMQHQAINHYMQSLQNWVLPLKIEEIPTVEQFDTVLSMGVIYHRRDPVAHVEDVFALTRTGGQAVLESIVADKTFRPKERYARMRNVWCIPSPADLATWMCDAGFTNVAIVDDCVTTLAEQRSTAWMEFESLAQALDPADNSRTVEGYPAPRRAIVRGTRR
jgi:tRNA (mo5U34)-methyltransferase